MPCLKRLLAVFALLALLLPASALAGGASGPQCGKTIPEGPFKQECRDIKWLDLGGRDALSAKCPKSPGSTDYNLTAMPCGRIAQCGWRLRNSGGNLACE